MDHISNTGSWCVCRGKIHGPKIFEKSKIRNEAMNNSVDEQKLPHPSRIINNTILTPQRIIFDRLRSTCGSNIFYMNENSN